MRNVRGLLGPILIALLAAAASPEPPPPAVYVNGRDATCQDRAPCYSTIAAAVAAVSPGGRVVIQAGVYPEQVSIEDKNDLAGAGEPERIVIEADPEAAPGSVVIAGAVPHCADGFAVRFRRSRYVTLRGVTITAARGPAIFLMGGHNQNRAIHVERVRIFGNGGPECDGGITIGRGNPETLIVNSLIHGNGRNGVAFPDGDGGPHYLVNNTIHGHAWNGVSVARGHVAFLVNNAITQNGTAAGSAGGRVGVQREGSATPTPAALHLLHNLVCGNRLGELDGPALDGADAGNLTPTGTEGPGVLPSPGCEIAANVYAHVAGPDAFPQTADDDFAPAPRSPAVDRGMDPRTLGLDVLFDALFEADLSGEHARPRNATRVATATFDIGALEFQPPNQPPAASAGADRSVVEGAVVALDGTGSSDPDGDPLTYHWSQSAGPAVTLDRPETATPSFTAPRVAAATALTFALQVGDGLATDAAGVTITVLPANRAPVLDPIGDRTVAAGGTLTFTVAATDPDGDPLTFTAQPLPANATFDPATRVFTFTPDAGQAGPIGLTFSVSDGRGGSASESITITVTPGLQITITSPADGAAVPEGLALVTGTLDANGQDVGVSVNGLVAAVERQRFAAQVPVTADVTTLTAIATAVGGPSATHTVAIAPAATAGPAPVLSVRPASGVAPLSVQFTLSGIAPAAVALDADGDGSADVTGPTLDGQRFTYARPGLYFPTATVTDGAGAQRVVTTIVHVESPAAVEARFSALWGSFRSRLQRGDVAGALEHLSPKIRPQFDGVFQDLAANLPAVAAGLEDVVALEQIEDLAEAALVRQRDGQSSLYFLYFRRDSLGRWLIEEM